eukprot:Skav225074  [mRNA]  locus=scaffold6117:18506:19462:+ [translate_table: standard]
MPLKCSLTCLVLWLCAVSASNECDAAQLLQIKGGKEQQLSAVIFYNLFVQSKEDIPRVSKFVREQLSLVKEVKEIRITSIGAVTDLSQLQLTSAEVSMSLVHHAEGWEDLTLRPLWSFCREVTDPNQLVIYMHSKGSFHKARGDQSTHRVYVSKGALSEECLQMPAECNVCSSRFTPIPYAQTPGNMWAARCSYVANLADPQTFDLAMETLPWSNETANICLGRERFAREHWIYSHPDAAPCDLDAGVDFVNGFGSPRSSTFIHDLKRAPRFKLAMYHWNKTACAGWGESLEKRLTEYEFLYKQKPSADWWGWNFFSN